MIKLFKKRTEQFELSNWVFHTHHVSWMNTMPHHDHLVQTDLKNRLLTIFITWIDADLNYLSDSLNFVRSELELVKKFKFLSFSNYNNSILFVFNFKNTGIDRLPRKHSKNHHQLKILPIFLRISSCRPRCFFWCLREITPRLEGRQNSIQMRTQGGSIIIYKGARQ